MTIVPQSTDGKQNWRTPKWVFDGFAPMGLQLDVAADPLNALLPGYLTAEQDALATRWRSPFWCNPPYRKAGKFVEHGIREAHIHGTWGVFLLRVPSIGCNWWVKTAPFCLTVPVTPRIQFVDHEAPDRNGVPHNSMFMIVTSKTLAKAKPGVTDFKCMQAATTAEVQMWLAENWELLF